MRGKGQFERILGLSWDAVPRLLASNSFRAWTNAQGRNIQTPVGWMRQVHVRIASLLARIEMPDYAFPQKGRSYVDNARAHAGRHPVVKTDISSFYPSVTRSMVVRTFLREFRCAEDIANVLGDVCCFEQQYLPTGSQLSGYLAFFSARDLFEDIHRLANKAGCTFTVYVDDITLSGPGANLRLLANVRRRIAQHGLKTKRSKSKSFSAAAPKTITGVIVVDSRLRLPNSKHHEIKKLYRDLQQIQPEVRAASLKKLGGRLAQAKQIQGR